MKRCFKSLREILWEDQMARGVLLGAAATMTAFCIPFGIGVSQSFKKAAQAPDMAKDDKTEIIDLDAVLLCPPVPGPEVTRHNIKAVTHDGLKLSFTVYASINTGDPRNLDYPTLWNKSTPLSATDRDKVVSGGIQKALSGYAAWEIDTTGQIGRLVKKLVPGKTGPVSFTLKTPPRLLRMMEREMAGQISSLNLNTSYPDLPFTLRVEDGEMQASAPRDKIHRMTKPKNHPKDLPPRL